MADGHLEQIGLRPSKQPRMSLHYRGPILRQSTGWFVGVARAYGQVPKFGVHKLKLLIRMSMSGLAIMRSLKRRSLPDRCVQRRGGQSARKVTGLESSGSGKSSMFHPVAPAIRLGGGRKSSPTGKASFSLAPFISKAIGSPVRQPDHTTLPLSESVLLLHY